MAPSTTRTAEGSHRSTDGTLARAPGPDGMEWAHYYYRLLRGDSPLDLFFDLAVAYPGLARFWQPVVAADMYVLSDPEYLEHVMLRNPDVYISAIKDVSRIDFVLGNGLLVNRGESWEQQHRLIAPMFHRKSVRAFGDLMLSETRRMLERWRSRPDDDEPLDLLEEMKRLTLLVIAKALFTRDVEDYVDQVRESLRTLRGLGRQGIRALLAPPMWVPTPANRRAHCARDRLDEIVYGLIEERRGHEEEYDDFLSMLMRAEDPETGETMDDRQIRDEVMTFFLAGHETTANALTWTWLLLARHPEVRERLHDEARENPMDDGFDRETYRALEYTRRVIHESLRLYPPVPVTGRLSRLEDDLDGYRVPKGTFMIASPYVVHRHPDVWEDPERFDPARFSPSREEARARFAYMPFGGGKRICTGREFAKMELRLVLSEVLRHVRLELVDPETPPGKEVVVTMEPERTLKARPRRW